MSEVERSALLRFTAEDLLALVRDVRRYPEFVPACSGARVQAEDDMLQRATLQFRFAGLSEEFETENRIESGGPGRPSMLQMRLLRGPFKSLSGEWRFEPLGAAACKVSLKVTVDWGGFSAARLLSSQLDRLVSAAITAFRERAEILYCYSVTNV